MKFSSNDGPYVFVNIVFCLGYISYSIIVLLYSHAWTESQKKVIVPKLRIAVFIIGGVLFFPFLIYGTGLVFVIAMGRLYKYTSFYVSVLIVLAIYFQIIAFMVIMEKNFKKSLNQ